MPDVGSAICLRKTLASEGLSWVATSQDRAALEAGIGVGFAGRGANMSRADLPGIFRALGAVHGFGL